MNLTQTILDEYAKLVASDNTTKFRPTVDTRIYSWFWEGTDLCCCKISSIEAIEGFYYGWDNAHIVVHINILGQVYQSLTFSPVVLKSVRDVDVIANTIANTVGSYVLTV